MRRRLTAFEAISLLATGSAVRYSDRHLLFKCRPSTWGVFWFDYIRYTDGRALTLHELANAFEARAKYPEYPRAVRGSEFDWDKPGFDIAGPCCLWNPVTNEGIVSRNPTHFYDEASSPKGPTKLWRTALRIRRALGRKVSSAELAELLRSDMQQDANTEIRLNNAGELIRDAIFQGELLAYGWPGGHRTRLFQSNLPERIPPEFFCDRKNVLTNDGWATLDPLLAAEIHWRDAEIKSWGDVWFYSSEVEAIHFDDSAPTPEMGSDEKSDKTGAPGRPSSAHLVKQELERRNQTGELADTLAKQSEALASWLKAHHPGLAQMTPRTVENSIRAIYRLLTSPRKETAA